MGGLLRLAVKSACIAGVSGGSELTILKKVLEELGVPNDQVNRSIEPDYKDKNYQVVFTSQHDSDQKVTEIKMNSVNLTGSIPEELNQLRSLRVLTLDDNQLHGKIPWLEGMEFLEVLSLARNNLEGPIPETLGQLRNMVWLDLEGNKLNETIPPELGNLSDLTVLKLDGNELEGHIPGSLWNLSSLVALALSNNRLCGRIGPLTNLQKLQQLQLNGNTLSGTIPPDVGKLENLVLLDLSNNSFTGALPKELSNLRELESLTLDNNHFTGQVPQEVRKLVKLQKVHLGNNSLEGSFPEAFCTLELRVLQLHKNRFHGRLPPCLSWMTKLTQLFLSNNKFVGPIPDLKDMSHLVLLLLHSNHFRGPIPNLTTTKLAIATFHRNDFSGAISGLDLQDRCCDNPRFTFHGLSCETVENDLSHRGITCADYKTKFNLETASLYANCPKTCGSCDQHMLSAKITLHGNWLACRIPFAISNFSVQATALMGNLLGDGTELNASWIPEEESQEFLYFSEEVWKSECWIFVELGLVSCLFLLPPVQKKLCRAITTTDPVPPVEARVIASYHQVLLMTLVMSGICCLTLPVYILCSCTITTCGSYLWHVTISWMARCPVSEVFVIIIWCFLMLFCRAALLTFPSKSKHSPGAHLAQRRIHGMANLQSKLPNRRKALGWCLWFLFILIISGPSIVFSMAEAVPKNSNYELLLKICHFGAPMLSALVDVFFARAFAVCLSEITDIQADRLMMMMQLCSSWLMPMCATLLLHENCAGGWKQLWSSCNSSGAGSGVFDWSIFEEKILTTTEVCAWSPELLLEERCSRSVVADLSQFVLRKNLTKAFLPMLFAAAWKLLEWAGAWESDQKFCRFLKTKATNCMNSMQQHVQMTTWLESVAVWAPFAPLVGVSITAAVATNFLLFDFAVAMHVPLLTDRNNLEASLSRAYFHAAFISSWAFQVWHAFSTQMQGRFMLLPMGIVVLLPKDTWFDGRKIEALWAAIRPRQRRPMGESESETLELRELGSLG
eukprot:symbB.v1.2.031811.t1/scaffold3735.1/size51219/1